MKEEIVEKLIKTLSRKFKRTELNLIFNGSIELIIKMKNIKFFVTKDIIIILDESGKELHIEPFYIDNIEFRNNNIKFEMEGDYTIQLENWRRHIDEKNTRERLKTGSSTF